MPENDRELVGSARRGDVGAFEQLVCKYDKHVLAIAARYGNRADDVKDIYQEVFLRVHRGLKNFQSKSEFTTWLYRITTNVCLTYRLQKNKHAHARLIDDPGNDPPGPAVNLEAHDATPHEQAMASEISARVGEALGLLSPQQKLVFTLRHYEGYKLREIASMMECTEGTVKRYLFTATRRMREQLRGMYEA